MGAGTGPGETLGCLLRRYRIDVGLTQEELAQRSGLSVRALADIERGRTAQPYLRSVRLIADALGLGEPGRAELLAALRDRVEEKPARLACRPRVSATPSSWWCRGSCLRGCASSSAGQQS